VYQVTQALSLFFGNTSSPVNDLSNMAKGVKAADGNQQLKVRVTCHDALFMMSTS
jgi:hypothetical protein